MHRREPPRYLYKRWCRQVPDGTRRKPTDSVGLTDKNHHPTETQKKDFIQRTQAGWQSGSDCRILLSGRNRGEACTPGFFFSSRPGVTTTVRPTLR